MNARLRMLGAAWRDRNLARILLAFAAYCLLDQAGWVAILVYAYVQGGATEAGLVAFALLMPAAFLAPVTALLGDRARPESVLAGGYAFQALVALAIAAALTNAAPPLVVYGLAALMLWAMGVTEPLHYAFLPLRTRASADLAAANVSSGALDSLAAFAGPALAAAIFSLFGPAPLFAGLGLLMLGAALAIASLTETRAALAPRDSPSDMTRVDAPADARWTEETTEGLRWLRAQPGALRLFSLFAVLFFFIGALDVAYVALAVERLALPEAGAGWLAAGFGLGGVFGAISSAALMGRRRLTPALATGGLLAGLPIAAVAGLDDFGSAFAALVASGIGTSLIAISGRMLLQGITPVDVLARVFGAFEGLSAGSLALGAAAAGLAIPNLGLSTALLALGMLFPSWLVLGAPAVLAMDAHRRLPEADRMRLLRAVPIFALLPAYTMETLVAQLEPRSLEAHETLIRENEAGDRLYVIAKGEARVSQGGALLRVCGPGECVGEIALLEDRRRTATVEAGADGLEVFALDRTPFLEALNGHARTLRVARGVARERLASDIDRRRDG